MTQSIAKAKEAVRFSLSHNNTEAELKMVLNTVKKGYGSLKQ